MNRGASRTGSRPPPDDYRPSTKSGARAVKSKGAEQAKTRLSDVSNSYWRHHYHSLVGSFYRLVTTPISTLMTALVVAIALALPAVLLLALGNIQQLGKTWDANPKISVYLNLRAKDTAIEQLDERLRSHTELATVVYVSREEALQKFQQLSGFGSALNSLDENPLPASFEVMPRMLDLQPGRLLSLAQELEVDPIIDQAIIDMDWVRRLLEFMALGKKIVYSLASLLAFGALLAIGNTVRLAIENRRDEIIVAKLVGATNGFVRRPFLYTGIWYGLFGGLCSCVIVIVGFSLIDGSVERLVALYNSHFVLKGLGVAGVLKLLVLSALLGLCGSWLAVSRHLSAIKPH